MKPTTLGLYSWLRHRDASRAGEGFSRMQKEMNRGSRVLPIFI